MTANSKDPAKDIQNISELRDALTELSFHLKDLLAILDEKVVGQSCVKADEVLLSVSRKMDPKSRNQ